MSSRNLLEQVANQKFGVVFSSMGEFGHLLDTTTDSSAEQIKSLLSSGRKVKYFQDVVDKIPFLVLMNKGLAGQGNIHLPKTVFSYFEEEGFVYVELNGGKAEYINQFPAWMQDNLIAQKSATEHNGDGVVIAPFENLFVVGDDILQEVLLPPVGQTHIVDYRFVFVDDRMIGMYGRKCPLPIQEANGNLIWDGDPRRYMANLSQGGELLTESQLEREIGGGELALLRSSALQGYMVLKKEYNLMTTSIDLVRTEDGPALLEGHNDPGIHNTLQDYIPILAESLVKHSRGKPILLFGQGVTNHLLYEELSENLGKNVVYAKSI